VRGTTTCSDFYVNSHTGIFAGEDIDVLPAIKELLKNRENYNPRNYFLENLTVKESARYMIECITHTTDSFSHLQPGE